MAKRRARKTNYGIEDMNALMEAIKKVRIEKRSVKSVAAAHGFNRQTLTNIVVEFDAAVPDISKVPNDELFHVQSLWVQAKLNKF